MTKPNQPPKDSEMVDNWEKIEEKYKSRAANIWKQGKSWTDLSIVLEQMLEEVKELSYQQGYEAGMLGIGKIFVKQFEKFHCEHGKQSNETCEKCGRSIGSLAGMEVKP